MTDTPATINVSGIIQHFGGTTQTWRRLRNHGINVSLKTVKAWGTRNSIPAVRLVHLVEIAAVIGKPLVVESFLQRPDKTAPNPLP